MDTKTSDAKPRAVIYARYSTDIQRPESIEDQFEVCRRYAEPNGWAVVRQYDDAALSGQSLDRPGYQRLLRDAARREFDVLVCEAIDRLGRTLAEIASMYERLTFWGVKVYAKNIGLVTPMHIAVMGMMAEMMVSDTRDRVKRGQLGRARAGRIPGGLAYGYEVVPPPPGAKEAGERRIVPAEASIVRRIFAEYAGGRSPRQIARRLNEERVPGPQGRPWGDTTIRGQPDRGTGLLNNTLYIGRLSWNRVSYVKNPTTGRRVARVNARSDLEEADLPDLRIVTQEAWDAVRARQASLQFEIQKAEGGQPLNRAHRRKFLLSGLLVCGCCGGGYTIVAQDRYGCATRRSKGTCDNASTVSRQTIEARVLTGLKDRMLSPQIVAEFVRALAEDGARHARDAATSANRLRSELAQIERRLAGIMRAIEDGTWSETLRAHLKDLEQQKGNLMEALAAAEGKAPIVILHPNASELYKAEVAQFIEALNDPLIRDEAVGPIQSLIDRVVLTPDPAEPNGLRAELHGDLAMILSTAGSAASTPKRAAPGPRGAAQGGGSSSLLSVVAGTRNRLDLLLTT